jgi:ADP-heptose:LPS heptosyltransferase
MRGIFPIFTSLVFEATGAAIRIGRNTTGRQALMRPRELGFIGREEMAEKAKRNLLKEKHRKNPHTTHTIRLEPSALRQYHESARIFEPIGLQFERKAGEPRMRPNPSAGRWAQKLLRSHWGEEQDIIIGFTMETTRKIKSWALDNFFSVVTSGLQEQLKFVLLGVNRQPENSPFKRLPRNKFLDLSGSTSIGEMIAVISQCNVFFSCDTGPAHIAQAIGIPSVVLFGPSNEMEFGPFDRKLHTLILPSGDWSCRPCVLGPCIQKRRCMEAITVEAVYNAIRQKITRYPKQVFNPNTENYKSPEVICAI